MIMDAKRRAINRKLEAIRLLDSAKIDIDNRIDIIQSRFVVPGIESSPLAISELDLMEIPMFVKKSWIYTCI